MAKTETRRGRANQPADPPVTTRKMGLPSLFGAIADRPDATRVVAGTTFHDLDTGATYVAQPTTPPRPRRPRLPDALAALTDADAAWWAAALARGAGVSLASGREGRRVDLTDPNSAVGASLPLTVTDPAEAWEVLATRGVIPQDWVGSEARRFICPLCWKSDKACGPCDVCAAPRATSWSAPWTLESALLLASDVEGVLAAEACGRVLHPRGGAVWVVGRRAWSLAVTNTWVQFEPPAEDERLAYERLVELGYLWAGGSFGAAWLLADGL